MSITKPSTNHTRIRYIRT